MGIANVYQDFEISSAWCPETIKLKLQFSCPLFLKVDPTCTFHLEYIYELLIHFEP